MTEAQQRAALDLLGRIQDAGFRPDEELLDDVTEFLTDLETAETLQRVRRG